MQEIEEETEEKESELDKEALRFLIEYDCKEMSLSWQYSGGMVILSSGIAYLRTYPIILKETTRRVVRVKVGMSMEE